MTDKAAYVTRAEWLAATPGGIVQTHGLCDRDEIHDRHVFTSETYPTHVSGWECPGQAAFCRNCDDRGCMDCVCRTIHEDCVWDCPFCVAPGVRRA